MAAVVYLIPATLAEDTFHVLPPYLPDAVKNCSAFFVENERTARRFLKGLWKEMVIDNYKWYAIHKAEESVRRNFLEHIRQKQNIGIVSEAGCPGVADPGQILIKAAHTAGAIIKPLVGPNSLLLALMASGLNGQQFQFIGYLPVDHQDRIKSIRMLETESSKKNCTQIFIETPYRNNQLLESLLKTCSEQTLLCLAVDLTSPEEWIRTKAVGEWKKETVDLHKKQVVFLLLHGIKK